MGLRFFRRVRILPGLRLNLSKSGASVSVGQQGAWFTVGPKGTRTTVGLPGSGLSYTSTEPVQHAHPATSSSAPADGRPPSARRGFAWVALLMLVLIVVAVIVDRFLAAA